jgi:hypothetical protein
MFGSQTNASLFALCVVVVNLSLYLLIIVCSVAIAAFDEVDTNGNGKLGKKEFAKICKGSTYVPSSSSLLSS